MGKFWHILFWVSQLKSLNVQLVSYLSNSEHDLTLNIQCIFVYHLMGHLQSLTQKSAYWLQWETNCDETKCGRDPNNEYKGTEAKWGLSPRETQWWNFGGKWRWERPNPLSVSIMGTTGTKLSGNAKSCLIVSEEKKQTWQTGSYIQLKLSRARSTRPSGKSWTWVHYMIQGILNKRKSELHLSKAAIKPQMYVMNFCPLPKEPYSVRNAAHCSMSL